MTITNKKHTTTNEIVFNFLSWTEVLIVLESGLESGFLINLDS